MNILCGYNVNIDSVYKTTGKDISKLLTPERRDEIIDKVENPPGSINSITDFIAGLVICMKEGTGAEWLVHEKCVFDFLKANYFPRSMVRMGGNAGIMTNVLSQMGASRVIPNVPIPSDTQISLFSKKATVFPDSKAEDDKITDTGYTQSEAEEPIHFVLDFKKGEEFQFYGETIKVPRENRFIATYDKANIELAINPDFRTYALKHIDEMDGALVSGFHMLMERYPDGSGYAEKFYKVIKQIKEWKQKNKKLLIHTEFGHFSNKDIASFIFSNLPETVDSIGMNEDELAMIHEIHGVPVEGILKMEAPSIIEAATKAASGHGLRKMIVHTREFILSVCQKEDSDPTHEIESMEFGARCAAAFASTGKLEGRRAVEEATKELDESAFGVEQAKRTIDHIGGKRYGSGAWGEHDGYVVSIHPTILCENPIATVGLGDTLASATFLRQLELSR